jgi:putative nucleotidyltransferase with HDIG domain
MVIAASTVIANQNVDRQEIPPALPEVPPFSAVAIKALQFMSGEYGELRELSDLITTDPAISGSLLRMANSAFFGIRVQVSSIFHAIHLLGLERVKSVVATIAMKSYLGASIEIPALRACWRHSLACAILAEKLAHARFMEADIAYTAGLLHDIGRLALVAGYPKTYADFLASTEHDPCDVLEREQELFRIDHCQAGLLLVSRWNLPKIFITITSRHHDAAVEGELPLLSVVRRSCQMADSLGFAVVHCIRSRTYDEIVGELPKRERDLLPPEPSELTESIATKINSIECV